MKYLKIENDKGLYSLDGSEWLSIDRISKDDLLSLLDTALTSEFDMDVYDESKIANQAHQIIYQNIFRKFEDILKNKKKFKDQSEMMYKKAIEKYGQELEQST